MVYLAHSTITLLSEHQVRNKGIIIDSCSTTHLTNYLPPTYGRQQLEWTNDDGTIDWAPMIDRGGHMGIPLFPYEPGDNTKLQIINITSSDQWIPQRHCRDLSGALTDPNLYSCITINDTFHATSYTPRLDSDLPPTTPPTFHPHSSPSLAPRPPLSSVPTDALRLDLLHDPVDTSATDIVPFVPVTSSMTQHDPLAANSISTDPIRPDASCIYADVDPSVASYKIDRVIYRERAIHMTETIPDYDLSTLLGSPWQTTPVEPTPIPSIINVPQATPQPYAALDIFAHIYLPDDNTDLFPGPTLDSTDTWLSNFSYDTLVGADIRRTPLERSVQKLREFRARMSESDVFHDPIMTPWVNLGDLCFRRHIDLTDEEEDLPCLLLPSSEHRIRAFALKH